MKAIFSLFVALFFKQNIHVQNLSLLPVCPPQHTKTILSLWDYKDHKTKKMIRFMKTHRSYVLSKQIGTYASEYLYEHIAEQQLLSYFKQALIIPVPISKKRVRERGFNQNHLWGTFLSKHLPNISYKSNYLIKIKSTKKQALIKKRQERFLNIKGVFSVPIKKQKYIQNKDIILIDDLTTTGATLAEAARTLKKAGARNIIMLSLAH